MALRHCQPLDEPTVLVARPDTRRARRGQAVPDRADPSSHRGRRAGRFNRRSLRLPRRELQPPGAGRTTDVDAHGAPAAAQSGMGRRRWFGDCARCAGAPGEFRQPIALADLAGRGPEARSLRPDPLPYACAAVGRGRRRAARQPCTRRAVAGALQAPPSCWGKLAAASAASLVVELMPGCNFTTHGAPALTNRHSAPDATALAETMSCAARSSGRCGTPRCCSLRAAPAKPLASTTATNTLKRCNWSTSFPGRCGGPESRNDSSRGWRKRVGTLGPGRANRHRRTGRSVGRRSTWQP